MMLKLTEHVEITIFLLYKQKNSWNSDIQNFYGEMLIFFFWIFAYYSQKIAIFRSGMFFMTSYLRNALANCTRFGMYG